MIRESDKCPYYEEKTMLISLSLQAENFFPVYDNKLSIWFLLH